MQSHKQATCNTFDMDLWTQNKWHRPLGIGPGRRQGRRNRSLAMLTSGKRWIPPGVSLPALVVFFVKNPPVINMAMENPPFIDMAVVFIQLYRGFSHENLHL